MAEYIEHTCGECIHSEICEHLPTLTGWDALNPAYCRTFKNAADVVEVVRCKDCVNYYEYEDWDRHCQESYVCHECRLFRKNLGENGYCSYGERRADHVDM